MKFEIPKITREELTKIKNKPTLYGGARGGGKSFWLHMINDLYQKGLITKEEYEERLREYNDKLKEWYGDD